MPSVTEKIQEILLPITESFNAFIVDVVLRGERTSKVIEIYVDSDNGISLDQCADISRQLSEKMDEADLIPGRYRMDVSSPGVDRPLKLLRQYHRNVGRVCKVKYTADGKRIVLEGKLSGVTEKNITVMKNGKPVEVSFTEIIETFIIPHIK
jgi:ribosome maturation factor RimP